MRARNLCIVSLALLGLGSFAQGQGLVDVAFSWGSPVPTGAAYIGSSGDIWNQYLNPSGTGISMANNLGQTTTATLTYVGTGTVRSAATGQQPDPALTDYYLYNNVGGPITLGIAGLAPSSQYNLVLYLASDDGNGDVRSENVSVTGASTTMFYATGNSMPTWDPTTNPLNNIAYLTVTSSALGTLSITETDGFDNQNGEVDLNGFQLQGQFNAVPEPAPFAALGLGALGLMMRRRRR